MLWTTETRDLRIGRLRSNRILIESGVTIRIRIESRIESAVYRPLTVRRSISIPPIQFVHCSSAGLPHRMLCYVTRVACCVCNFVDL